VLDPTPHPVSLVYEDQTVVVVTSQVGITNARQLLGIRDLNYQKDEEFDDGSLVIAYPGEHQAHPCSQNVYIFLPLGA